MEASSHPGELAPPLVVRLTEKRRTGKLDLGSTFQPFFRLRAEFAYCFNKLDSVDVGVFWDR